MSNMIQIPKEYTIHGQTIKVIIEDHDVTDNRYGYYHDVKEEIHLFRKVKVDGEMITLTDYQIETTFWHEVVHSFQFHSGLESSEQVAQTMSGLIMEFLKSSNIKINPNLVHAPIDGTYED